MAASGPCPAKSSQVSLNQPHLSRLPCRTVPGVPESAPPGALWGETDCVGTLWGYSAGKEWGVIMPEEYIIYSQGKKAGVFMSWEY